jgi:hypothetical protein
VIALTTLKAVITTPPLLPQMLLPVITMIFAEAFLPLTAAATKEEWKRAIMVVMTTAVAFRAFIALSPLSLCHR